jgi:hypothetical protein
VQDLSEWGNVHWKWRIADSRPSTAHGNIELRLTKQTPVPAQGYTLIISPKSIVIEARDGAGAFYGTSTLRQLLRSSNGSLPCLTIEDSPDFLSRGLMIDISRDKVPRLSTLFGLVDMLAEWKINHLELYTEHTFAYRNHREVWAQASPMTAENICKLDEYCRERYVELVPNQNSFGHMKRWLDLPKYRRLAECPDGFVLPWGHWHKGPFSLNPAHPGSIALLEELYKELLPNFTSKKFNVGCDETWDLGQGKCKVLCEEKGVGTVYLDFLLQINNLANRHGRTMHFWGDIVLKHPEVVPKLPRNAVALLWGYGGTFPFNEHGVKFAKAKIPFYVCPGLSSASLVGRTENCLLNQAAAAKGGLMNGAVGYLNTDWGDCGHLGYLPSSFLGYAAGAAYSWCQTSAESTDFGRVLDEHAFFDRAGVMGKFAYDLGNNYRIFFTKVANDTPLFWALHRGDPKEWPDSLSEPKAEAARKHVESIETQLQNARMARSDAELIIREYRNSIRMLLHACKRAKAVFSGNISKQRMRNSLADDMRIILGEHRELWVARNRVGGLQDSTRELENRLSEYTEERAR